MIRLIDMLDRLRRRLGIPYTNLSRHLGISTASLRSIIISSNIHNEQIKLWCEFLKLYIQDYEPLYQYHARERLYHALPGIREGLPEPIRMFITDVLYFHKKLKGVSELHNKVYVQIISHIYSLPHIFINVHTEIKNKESV
jgi:hypothetical protein